MYSIVKTMVKNHSNTPKTGPQRARIGCTLSSTTTRTLTRMTAISARSNHRPARVSDSKMIA